MGYRGTPWQLNLPCYNTYTLSSLLTTATQNSDNGSTVSFAHFSLVYIQDEATVFTCSFRELELFLVKNQIQFSSYCTLNLERSSFLFFQLPGKKKMHAFMVQNTIFSQLYIAQWQGTTSHTWLLFRVRMLTVYSVWFSGFSHNLQHQHVKGLPTLILAALFLGQHPAETPRTAREDGPRAWALPTSMGGAGGVHAPCVSLAQPWALGPVRE